MSCDRLAIVNSFVQTGPCFLWRESVPLRVLDVYIVFFDYKNNNQYFSSNLVCVSALFGE